MAPTAVRFKIVGLLLLIHCLWVCVFVFCPCFLRPDFFYYKNVVDLRFIFRFRTGGTKKKSFENDQLTGHFQSFFSSLFSLLLRAFLISPENSQTSKVNQQSVLNL